MINREFSTLIKYLQAHSENKKMNKTMTYSY